MALRPGTLRAIFARRRERKASRRMAIGLAVVLGCSIALPFAYWRYQLHQVLGSSTTTEALTKQCEKLDQTLALVTKEAGKLPPVNPRKLEDRRSECEEMGFETTGSIEP